EPSKVISDQYKASIVLTADGKAYTGRIVAESADSLTVVTDPEDATKAVTIPRSDVTEIQTSSQSLMPKGLIDTLNEEEVLDLVAYTLSRDKGNGGRFKKKK
ncbi:MAG: heme-binding protein, partial [Planctomycetota bacterium]